MNEVLKINVCSKQQENCLDIESGAISVHCREVIIATPVTSTHNSSSVHQDLYGSSFFYEEGLKLNVVSKRDQNCLDHRK